MRHEEAAYLPLKFEASDIFPKRIIAVRPDVHITVSGGTFQARTEREAGTTAPVFELSYSRRSSLSGEVDRIPVELRPGYATLGFLGRADGRCEYAGGEEVLLYSIWIGPGAFDHFCEAVCGGRSAGFRAFQTDGYNCRSFLSDAREESILHRLDALLSEGADPLNRLLLESHLLELISINMEKLLCGDCRRGGLEALTRTDRAQLDHAREILLRRLDHPPSLVELSRMLHMNDCKLKRAFKAYHGQTVYEFVRGQRLERAFSLLERGGCNVSEAAFAVGYTNVSHFSEAFCRQFGVLPRALCKTGRSHTR